MRMGRRGRKRQLGVEDEYWRLVPGGVGTVEACRLGRFRRFAFRPIGNRTRWTMWATSCAGPTNA
jgi:hypothetical protein